MNGTALYDGVSIILDLNTSYSVPMDIILLQITLYMQEKVRVSEVTNITKRLRTHTHTHMKFTHVQYYK